MQDIEKSQKLKNQIKIKCLFYTTNIRIIIILLQNCAFLQKVKFEVLIK